jgi:hypothetical protein
MSKIIIVAHSSLHSDISRALEGSDLPVSIVDSAEQSSRSEVFIHQPSLGDDALGILENVRGEINMLMDRKIAIKEERTDPPVYFGRGGHTHPNSPKASLRQSKHKGKRR